MRPKVRAWVLFPGDTKFGHGRAELLRLVDEEGSLKRAVERLGMSYRAAWGYIRELESAAGFRIVEPGGPGPSAGTRLTERGRRFIASFDAFQEEVDAVAARAFRRAFRAGTKPPPARRRRRRKD